MSAEALDVLLDPDTGDLPAFSTHGAGMEVIAQRVETRLQTHLGDWPLDVTVGIDWVGYLAAKPLDVAALAADIALEIAATPGVSRVVDLDWAQSGEAVTISATVLTMLGRSLTVVVQPQTTTGNPSITVGGVLGHSRTITP